MLGDKSKIEKDQPLSEEEQNLPHPEILPSLEKTAETQELEPSAGSLSNEIESVNTSELPSVASPLTPVQKGDKQIKIEKILEQDLADIYSKMTPIEQQEFKKKGEETTTSIIQILNKPKFKIKNIVILIKNWLQIIPGVNKFFLEQTAKIKADKIVDSVGQRDILP